MNERVDFYQLEIKKRDEIIAKLEAIIVEQSNCIAELERHLGLNSKNSGKPPSSDGLQKSPVRTKSLRGKSNKTVGGQPGHKGTTLKQVQNPDIIEQRKATCCPDCKIDLVAEPVIKTYKRQVFDIPKIKPIVTEHQFEVKQCPGCKKKVEAQSDSSVNAPVQYGNAAKAQVVYLNSEQLIPQERVAKIMKQTFHLPMTVSTVENILQAGAKHVVPVVKTIFNHLKIVPQKHADESGIRIAGKTQWLHILSNENLVYYRASEKRGDVPKDLIGVVTHDHFVSYYSQMKDVEHSLCNAHHLRELKAVEEIDKEPWARKLTRLLLIGNAAKKNNPQGLPATWVTRFRRIYGHIINEGLEYHEKLGILNKPARGRVKRRPGHNLLLRLQNREDDVLRFLHDPNVPFSNNLAERDLRMIKVKQKISGSFRTSSGAQQFLTLKSYIATAKKNGVSVLDALTAAFDKKPLSFVPT